MSFCLSKLLELQQLWIHVILMCHKHMVKTQQHKMYLLIHTVQSYIGLWVHSLAFAFFFMQVYLFSTMYQKKVLFSKQWTWNGTLFLYSLFQLVVSPETSLDCICSTFILAVFFLFSFLSLCLFFCMMVLFMSCHLHVPAESTCTTYNKWRFHNIKCVEAVLDVLSMTVCRKDTGNYE